MRKKIILSLVAVCFICGALVTRAYGLSRNGTRMMNKIQFILNSLNQFTLPKAGAFFDNNGNLKPNVNVNNLRVFAKDLRDSVIDAGNAYEKIPREDLNDPSVVQVKQTIDKLRAMSEKASGGSQVAQQRKTELNSFCISFRNDVSRNAKASAASHLVDLVKNPQDMAVWIQSKVNVDKIREAIPLVKAACDANPKFKEMSEQDCYGIALVGDPQAWCNVVGRAEELIALAVKNHIAHRATTGASVGPQPDKLENEEGFLSGIGFDGPIEWKEDLYFSKKVQKFYEEQYKKIFDNAGIKYTGDKSIFQVLIDYREALRQKVEELAPKWETPKSATTSHYSIALAKKKIKGWHKKANIKKVFMIAKTWDGPHGYPPTRNMGGYVLYQLPGEKWCQLRYFNIRENYMGGGRWQKGEDVGMTHGVRFQECNK